MEINTVPTVKKNETIERKEFMKQVGLGFGAILLMNCLQACADSEIPDPMPGGNTGKVDMTLDLNLSANSALNTKGGSKVSNGVIVARTLNDTFIAVASTCTHENTTNVNYRPSTNDFQCPKHDSEFKATGAVQKGPASSPLTKYAVTFDETNNTVRVFE